jgi:hypothetical protein
MANSLADASKGTKGTEVVARTGREGFGRGRSTGAQRALQAGVDRRSGPSRTGGGI